MSGALARARSFLSGCSMRPDLTARGCNTAVRTNGPNAAAIGVDGDRDLLPWTLKRWLISLGVMSTTPRRVGIAEGLRKSSKLMGIANIIVN